MITRRPLPATTGSSPLTRGKCPSRLRCCRGSGLIPAHAGKIPPRTRSHHGAWAHPRSRGENFAEAGISTSMRGSSPLTRGKYRLPSRCHRRHGLIPAHAGKIRSAGAAGGRLRAHPRSRGENLLIAHLLLLLRGSSPLTRGKYRQYRPASAGSGLIPAHAGKIRLRTADTVRPRAHPRSRGENEAGDEKGSTFEGSSPLTRGKYAPVGPPVGRRGLIPAHAGKILAEPTRTMTLRAHPRSRGENHISSTSIMSARGSSPLTRGKCPPRTKACELHGLIPAHAGKIAG